MATKTTTSPAPAPAPASSPAPLAALQPESLTGDAQTSALRPEPVTYVRPTATVLILEDSGFGRPGQLRELPQEWAIEAEARGLLTTDPAQIEQASNAGQQLTELEPVQDAPPAPEAPETPAAA